MPARAGRRGSSPTSCRAAASRTGALRSGARLAGDAVFLRQFQGCGFVAQPPRFDDVALAFGRGSFMALISSSWRSPISSRSAWLSWSAVSSASQSCHSLSGFRTQGRVEGGIGPDRWRFMSVTSVWVTPSWSASLAVQCSGCQIAFLDSADLGLGLAQIEEQFLLRGGGATASPCSMTRSTYSWMAARIHHIPHRSGKTEALVGIEALDRLHQPRHCLRNAFRNRQAIAAIAHCDLGDQAQMAGHQLARGAGRHAP